MIEEIEKRSVEKDMKKGNILFILECIIIVLLLAILGVLLKDNVGNKTEEAIVREVVETEDELEEVVSEETENTVSGIVNVADVVPPSENMTDETVVPSEEVVAELENTISSNSVSENDTETVSSNSVETSDKFLNGKNIVVFGDSIWNDGRDVDGISEYVQEKTGATIYNCAVGGSTAALVGENTDMQNWTSSSFNGMIYVARDLVSVYQVIPEREATEIVRTVDFENMDYVIVAYGLNDFFSNVPIYPETYFDIKSYVGALRNGISKLQENYPHLQIIVVSPTYTKLFEGEKQFEIGSYVEAARGVASEMNVHFLDMFHVLGNDEESRTQHLGDGVHLSAEGRKVYANAVVSYLKTLEE